MVAQNTQVQQLEPELAMAVRELKRNHNFNTLVDHLRDRREDLIAEMALPAVLTNHAFLAAITGRTDEINYFLDVLKLAGGDNESLLDKS